MSNNVLVFLSFLNRKESIFHPRHTAVLFLALLITTFFRGKIGVHTHQTRDTSDIFISVEPSDQVDDSLILRFGTHIKQNDELRVEVTTETLEKPQMGGQFSAVEMFEAAEDFEMFRVVIF